MSLYDERSLYRRRMSSIWVSGSVLDGTIGRK